MPRSERLGPAFDLLGAYRPDGFFLERAGVGLCTWGAVDRVAADGGARRTTRLADAVADRLAAIGEVPDGPGPVAVGALPFAPDVPAHLTVASHVVSRGDDGVASRLDLADKDDAVSSDRWVGRAFPHEAFSAPHVTAVPEPSVYASMIARAVERIGDRALDKVVLARTLTVDANRELDPRQLLQRARSVDPECYAFAAPVAGGAILVGASPELLVRKDGPIVSLNPLAGSAPRAGDPAADRRNADGLLASDKEREEHGIVVRSLAAALAPLCDDLDVPDEPELLATANVWHLSTRIGGRVRSDVDSVLRLVDAIHPTAAVGGEPTPAALATITELEPFDRGCYAGPIGWVDAAGDGAWAIALRCAELSGSTARLFAGAGIVAGSDPIQEVEETERKFRALLDALRWG